MKTWEYHCHLPKIMNKNGAIALSVINNGSIVVRNKVYFIGGRIGAADTDKVFYNDVLSEESKWVEGPKLPLQISSPKCLFIDDRIYVLNGIHKFMPTQRVFSVGINADGSMTTWREEDQLPYSLLHASFVAIDNVIYALGGIKLNSNKSISRCVYHYHTHPLLVRSRWSLDKHLLYAVSDAIPVLGLRSHIYLLGGHTLHGTTNHGMVSKKSIDKSVSSWVVGPKGPGHITDGKVFYTSDGVWVVADDKTKTGVSQHQVYYARRGLDGSIGYWLAVMTLPYSFMVESCYMASNTLYGVFINDSLIVSDKGGGIFQIDLATFL